MEDTLFHKGDKVYFTSGEFKFVEGEILSVMYNEIDGGIYYSVLVEKTEGRGKKKRVMRQSVTGITAKSLRKLN